MNPDNLAEVRVHITALDSDGEPLQSSEQGLDEWGGQRGFGRQGVGRRHSRVFGLLFRPGNKKDGPASADRNRAGASVYLEIQIGDPENQGIRACMPLYPMRHLNRECMVVEESLLGTTTYAFAQTPSHGWYVAYGRVNQSPFSTKLFQGETVVFSTPSYERHKVLEPYPGVTPLKGNLIALHSD